MNERQLSIWEDEIHQYPTPRDTLFELCPRGAVYEAFLKHYTKFREWDGSPSMYHRIMVSVSGGSDSDILIDMIERIGYEPGTVQYVFFNTGIEFQATRDHIKELEKKYGVQIEECKPKTPTIVACRRYGQPFLSKLVSQYINALQKVGFDFTDEPYEDLLKKYPRSKSYIDWWCNKHRFKSYNIERYKFLKEFMITNPPSFTISDKCCKTTKKDTASQFEKKFNPDLNVQGIRQNEGGVRSIAYKNCFDDVPFGCSKLRPLFWFSNEDKKLYEEAFDIEHSRCYTVYGFVRTGCAACPFGKDFEEKLQAAKQYEPGLYKAANMAFGDSYEYTRAYYKFRDEMKRKEAERERTE